MSSEDFAEPENLIADAIEAAENIRDPLEELVEKTVADPGAPFMPEALERLAALKKEDRAAFEVLRSQLKKAGCRVTQLDEAIAEENGDVGGRGPTQADILIELARSAELFHTPDGSGFADLDINGHRETWPIRAKGFRRWLARRFYQETGGAPNSEALQSALNIIEAKAHFDAPGRLAHIRVGGLDGRLYLDLGDETWRAVEIDATGWRVIDDPPVRFRRASGMKPMPIPARGGSVETLRSFLNVRSDADFVLVVAWALACLRNRGPYPVIVLSGEQGSAKSTFSAILRALLDPNTAPLRALPREDRDLFIAASNGHVLAFDNVSGLPTWISDTLCRLASGGGFAVRQLYSDQDEVLFDAARPVILNGIEDIVTRPDLADRAVFLTLEPIPEERRRPEQELWAAFETERSPILGVLLDAVAKGLAQLTHTKLDKLPRMADFALWATACETALWPQGTFWSAYCGNRDEAVEGVIDADAIAAAVRVVMATRTEWTGTASELLGALAEMAGERVSKSKTWPDNPRALAGRCRGRRHSCARLASRSPLDARAGRGRGSSISLLPGSRARQKPEGRDRPHRPHRPRIGRKSVPAMASHRRACGRSASSRTVQRAKRANRPRQLVEIQRRDRCGRCGRRSPAPIRAGKYRLEGAAMSAFQALKAARDAGVRIGVDGDALTLDADAAPPPAVLELLTLHKAEVIALLRPGRDGWSGNDWRAFFDERAGIAEFDGGLPRDKAEARAFACCVAEWLNRNPVRSPPGRCLGCGGSEQAHDTLLPFGTEPTGHAWLHSRCWDAWHAGRKAEAVAALSTLGICMRTSP